MASTSAASAAATRDWAISAEDLIGTFAYIASLRQLHEAEGLRSCPQGRRAFPGQDQNDAMSGARRLNGASR
jgi:hypothetical protein